ncbi:hypothetical protein B0H67DRAFT_526937 [Lasiosphaeris hirsuta]|uniref:NAD(P)-binding domain-containing protein n=1 Tax=Lasiosphaeris hirsuta TaxID=260670 RepID=A0AA40E6P5_9PEZI|nr:hypothetical protein B0H67DRAFT_526937 [Lasiosphaeris hirsuta]
MVAVAVAGGTGNVGRAIVEAIVATGEHEVKILSRTANPALEAEIGVPILAVDYSDVEAVAKVLNDNNIHTVVSGIAMHSVDGTEPHEKNLIRAADLSDATKRIISSDWGVGVQEDQIGDIPSVIHKVNARKELHKTKTLEYTAFHVGFLMDYWGIPVVKSYLARTPLIFWLDIPHNTAAIPGSGNVPAVFTHTTDVGRFVAASLDLPRWEPETSIFGDRLTWNEFLHYAEDAKGTKFNVSYDSVEDLSAGKTTELPSQVPFYQYLPKPILQGMAASFGLWFEKGLFDLKTPKFLNQDFPDIKPLKVKEMLDQAWRS